MKKKILKVLSVDTVSYQAFKVSYNNNYGISIVQYEIIEI